MGMNFIFDHPIDFYSEDLEIGVTVTAEVTYYAEEPDHDVGFAGYETIDYISIPGATDKENEDVWRHLTESAIQKLIEAAHEKMEKDSA